MQRLLAGLAAVLLIVGPAAAGELISTADGATAPASAAAAAPLGTVARGAAPGPLAMEDDQARPPPAGGCSAATDGKPHGVAWGAVGTHGYRSVGTAVTAPLGKCGSVSIAVSRTDGRGRVWGW